MCNAQTEALLCSARLVLAKNVPVNKYAVHEAESAQILIFVSATSSRSVTH